MPRTKGLHSEPFYNQSGADRPGLAEVRQTINIEIPHLPALKNQNNHSPLLEERLPELGEKRRLKDSDADLDSAEPADKKPRLHAEDLLHGLRGSLQMAIVAFKDHPNVPGSGWYRHLKMQLAAVDVFRGPVEDGLFEDPAVGEPYSIPDLSKFNYEPNVQGQIRTFFQKIESSRGEILSARIVSAPSTSTQETPALALRTAHLYAKLPGIVFLSAPFYLYALLCAYAPIHNGDDDGDYVNAFKVANLLIAQMVDFYFYEDGKELTNFLEVLRWMFPNDDEYCWRVNEQVTPEHQAKFDFAYCRLVDGYPSIIVDVREEMAGRDDLFAHSNALYSLSVWKFERIRRECGAPTIFVQLAGTNLSFAGAVCDSLYEPHTSQRLPGSVDLEKDFGYNLQQAAYSLWALKKSVNRLREVVKLNEGKPVREFVAQTPRVGLESEGVSITEIMRDGILYKARLEFIQSGIKDNDTMRTLELKGQDQLPSNTVYVLKVTYPHKKATYGIPVHELLAGLAFAPVLYAEFAPKDGMDLITSSKPRPNPLIMYHLMEFLPPPTRQQPGWITLEDLAVQLNVAIVFKLDIENTLHHIIGILRSNQMVHGDMRPNNILVKVKIQSNNLFRPLYRQDQEDLLDILVIDFDWSGKADEVRYPDVRNSAVEYWPGEDGQLINKYDDERMVEAWMKLWPEEFAD